MVRTTGRQAEEEPDPDAGLVTHLRYHGHHHRSRHRLVRAALVVPEWREDRLSLSLTTFTVKESAMKA